MTKAIQHTFLAMVLAANIVLGDPKPGDPDFVPHGALDEKRVKRLFKVMDINNDGSVSAEETHDFAKKIRTLMLQDRVKTTKQNHKVLADDVVHLSELSLGDDTLGLHQKNKFKAADVNGDGALDMKEIVYFWNPDTHDDVLKHEISRIMHQKDADGNTKLTLEEYLDKAPESGGANSDVDDWKMFNAGKLAQKQEAEFKMGDKDQDGNLDTEELMALKSGKSNMNLIVKTIWEKADEDNNDHITEKELIDARGRVVGTPSQGVLQGWAEMVEHLNLHSEL